MSSAILQEIAGAYNGYAWGGAHLTRKATGDFDTGESYARGRRYFECEWIVQVATDAAKATEITALRALAHPVGLFGIGRGRALAVTDGVVSGTTLTSTTGGFTTAMIGLPVSVVGIGAAQITARASTNSITISEAIGNGTALTVYVGEEDVRLPSGWNDGFGAEPEIEFPEDEQNTGLRWRVKLRVVWKIAADQARGVAGTYRREGSVAVRFGPSGHKIITFEGIYTGGGGNDATTNYTAQVATWVSARLSAEAITYSEYAPDLSAYSYDDQLDEFEFRLAYREIPRPQYGSGYDLSSVRRVQMRFSREGVWAHGSGGAQGVSVHRVGWSSAVDSNTSYDTHVALYTGTIKPYLVAQATALLGGTSLTILRERGPQLAQGPEANEIAGELVLLLLGSVNGNIAAWNVQVAYSEIDRKVFRHIHDGQPCTYVWWDPGSAYAANLAIEARAYEPQEADWTVPEATPPFAEAAGVAGSWIRTGRGDTRSTTEIGRDPEGSGTVVTEYVYRWRAAYLWVAAGEGRVKAPRLSPGRLWSEGERGEALDIEAPELELG